MRDECGGADKEVLGVSEGNADFVVSDRIENFERLGHIDKVGGIVEVQEGPAKLGCLKYEL